MIGRQVLIVDDEAAVCNMMKLAFRKAGYEVTTAESAEDALEFVKTYKYLVFFLDLNLPGMNGIDLCRCIRQDNPLAIAYAVTGYATMFEAFKCREAGFEDYFTKPVAMKTLIDAAEHAFQKLERWSNR